LNVDKIPIHLLVHSPGDEEYTLGTLKLTKADYANSEKSNEIIDAVTKELEDIHKRLDRLELRFKPTLTKVIKKGKISYEV